MATKSAPLRKPLAAKLPWTDKTGRFAPLKAVALVLLALPAGWLLCRAFVGDLGPRPYTEAIHKLGDWTVYLLLVSLAVTPARRLFNWSKLIQIRRMTGIAALLYALGHLALYIADSRFSIGFVASEIVFRIYLTIGFVALLGLIALGVTSTDGMIRRMGAREWNTLHRLIYLIAPLAILHYFMQSKLDVSQPALMAGFYVWLIGYRMLARMGIKEGTGAMAGLSAAAALLTAVIEATWYGVATGVGFERIILTNIDIGGQMAIGVRPAWWVLVTGLAVTAAAAIRRRASGPHRRGRIAAPA